MGWCEARYRCGTLGADLAVVSTSDIAVLQAFLDNNAANEEIWVGVKGRKWLDGRDVENSMWGGTDPNGDPEDCGRMRIFSEGYMLADMTCERIIKFLCMRSG
uniref:C-type lectin domain-containing protein n=1 Tax=Scylla olivacea TaxID=85551 RepID=A0A0P4VXP1_SCYOL